ncbi:ATP-binding cassette domain-containing protein [Puia sp. P3]|uniref:ATP-binding cassette domain-containing protein n=1 Tax=Puia sp. P3 TaxID=3423952 RepID=UPI003D676FC2
MLDHIARLKGIEHTNERKDLVLALLDKVNLYKDRDRKLGTYSGGMKQRWGIAQALVGNPRLIIVDEPTAGLDPAERNRFYNLLSQLGEQTIVILSTHIVEDVSTLCSQFAIICHGEVLYHGEPENAIKSLEGKIYSKRIPRNEIEKYRAGYPIVSTQLKAGQLYIRIKSADHPGNGFSPAAPDTGRRLLHPYFHKNGHQHPLIVFLCSKKYLASRSATGSAGPQSIFTSSSCSSSPPLPLQKATSPWEKKNGSTPPSSSHNSPESCPCSSWSPAPLSWAWLSTETSNTGPKNTFCRIPSQNPAISGGDTSAHLFSSSPSEQRP